MNERCIAAAREQHETRQEFVLIEGEGRRERRPGNPLIIGIALIILGFAAPFILDGDITVSLLLIPLGIFYALTAEVTKPLSKKAKMS